MSALLDQFTQQTSQIAAQLRIQHVVIAVRDPFTREVVLIASPGAMDNLRDIVAEKFKFTDNDPAVTEWPGG